MAYLALLRFSVVLFVLAEVLAHPSQLPFDDGAHGFAEIFGNAEALPGSNGLHASVDVGVDLDGNVITFLGHRFVLGRFKQGGGVIHEITNLSKECTPTCRRR